MISEVTGVTDTAALNAISEYVLNENDFTSLALSADKGDMTSFSTKMAEVVANSINKAAQIGSNATMIAGAFQAAGYMWEGDAEGAAKAVANAILDSTAYGKLLKLTVTVTDASIKSWKANGIEEMYQAYKNGADEGWFGYQVVKGDFGAALDQSAAIQRQIEIDAVKSYCNVTGKKESELTSSELSDIKSKAISNLEKKFKAREAQEAQIAKDKEYYKSLLDAFEENGVDDSVTIRVGQMDDLPYEQRMESYTRVADRILQITGKKIEFDGLVDDTEIPASILTTAIKKWYGPDGEKEVKGYLRSAGYLPAPKIEDLTGVWSGTMTFTEVYVDQDIMDSFTEMMKEGADSEEGCDQAMIDEAMGQLDSMEGTSEDVSYTAIASGNTLIMTSEDGDTMSLSYDSKTGALTLLSVSDSEDFEMSASMSIGDSDPPTMSGTMTATSKEQVQEGVTIPSGMIHMTISVHLTKAG